MRNKKNLRRRLFIRLAAIILLTTFSVGSLIMFGPLIGNIFGLISVNRNELVRPPEAKIPPPVIVNAPQSTNKTKINLQGVSAPKTNVELYLNGPRVSNVLTDMTGEFLFVDVELIKGKNTIFVKAGDTKSDTITIQYDNNPPKIEITSPEDGERISNLNERIEIEGTINEKAEIRINGKIAIQKPDNSFYFLLGVEEGETEINVVATDLAGNTSAKTITVEYVKR